MCRTHCSSFQLRGYIFPGEFVICEVYHPAAQIFLISSLWPMPTLPRKLSGGDGQNKKCSFFTRQSGLQTFKIQEGHDCQRRQPALVSPEPEVTMVCCGTWPRIMSGHSGRKTCGLGGSVSTWPLVPVQCGKSKLFARGDEVHWTTCHVHQPHHRQDGQGFFPIKWVLAWIYRPEMDIELKDDRYVCTNNLSVYIYIYIYLLFIYSFIYLSIFLCLMNINIPHVRPRFMKTSSTSRQGFDCEVCNIRWKGLMW